MPSEPNATAAERLQHARALLGAASISSDEDLHRIFPEGDIEVLEWLIQQSEAAQRCEAIRDEWADYSSSVDGGTTTNLFNDLTAALAGTEATEAALPWGEGEGDA